jgi:hypothetical protein
MKLSSRILQIVTHPATIRFALVLGVVWGSRTGFAWGT